MEFYIKWCQCPHVQHTPKVMIVEADNDLDARAHFAALSARPKLTGAAWDDRSD